MARRKFSRRDTLKGLGVLTAAAAGFGIRQLLDTEEPKTAVLGHHFTPSPVPSASPTPSPVPTTTRPVSGFVRSSAMIVSSSTRLRFDPAVSTTLEMSGNLVVEGVLEMRPNPGVTHILRFVGVKESAFVGGGNDPIPSDVGLWVMGGGRLDLAGRTTGGTVVFQGETFTVGRSVRIEGTPAGRSHIFIRSSVPQSISGVAIRFMGVAKPTGNPDPQLAKSALANGRYALHFHRCGDGSRGTIVSNVVVRDGENRAFVPHASHGITFRGCVAYNQRMHGWWWDLPDSNGTQQTDDLVIEDCRALRIVNILSDSPSPSGFTFAKGDRNAIRRSRAAGVSGWGQGAGFSWPRAGVDLGETAVTDCVSHHCDQGVFIWSRRPGRFTNFRAYSNALDVENGSYGAEAEWVSSRFESPGGFQVRGVGNPERTGIVMDRCVHLGPFIVGSHAVNATTMPHRIRSAQLEAGVLVDQANEPGRGFYRFENCTRSGRPLQQADFTVKSIRPGTVIEVQNADGSTFTIRG